MAKKATTTKQNNNNEPGKFAMMKMFFTNERTRFITGLVIAIITIYIGLSLTLSSLREEPIRVRSRMFRCRIF